jgi:hypothetical protein
MDRSHHTPAGERIVEPMIALAHCSKLQQIIVAGSKSVELMFELQRRGYLHVVAAANCGRPGKQYEVALVDWRRRTLRALETTLDWLVDYLSPEGVLVIWVDSLKLEAREALRSTLETRGFIIEDRTIREDGSALSARRQALQPIPKAA